MKLHTSACPGGGGGALSRVYFLLSCACIWGSSQLCSALKTSPAWFLVNLFQWTLSPLIISPCS